MQEFNRKSMKHAFTFLLGLLLLALATPALAQQGGFPTHDRTQLPPPPEGMQYYYMVHLLSGPVRSQNAEEAAEIQKGHLANIGRLAREGKIILAGPMLDGGELRGIFIFNVDTKAEVEELLATDPAIASERLKAEVMCWMGPVQLEGLLEQASLPGGGEE